MHSEDEDVFTVLFVFLKEDVLPSRASFASRHTWLPAFPNHALPCPAPIPALLISPTLLQFLFSVSQSTRHLCVGPISSFCFLRLRPLFRSSKEARVIVLFTDAVCLAHSRGSINTSRGKKTDRREWQMQEGREKGKEGGSMSSGNHWESVMTARAKVGTKLREEVTGVNGDCQ